MKKCLYRSWQDSNLQSPDPKSGALSIRPHDPRLTLVQCLKSSCMHCRPDWNTWKANSSANTIEGLILQTLIMDWRLSHISQRLFWAEQKNRCPLCLPPSLRPVIYYSLEDQSLQLIVFTEKVAFHTYFSLACNECMRIWHKIGTTGVTVGRVA